MVLRKCVTVVVVLFLAGCASKYRIDAVDVTRTASPAGGFYVMIASDGTYGATTYTGSGNMLAQEVYNALVVRSEKVVKASAVEPLDEALARAKEADLSYVIQAEILHWEDRATEWSGRPDRITIRYTAFEVGSGQQIAANTRSASSKWATFGGDHPQDLLPVPTREFVALLMGATR